VTRDISHDDSKGTMNDDTKRILGVSTRNFKRKTDALARKREREF
jgi:hypothetical protein